MYKEVDGITPPEEEATLWRYMSFEKFANILETESLFFTRADKFDDPFEGFIPSVMIDSYEESVKRVTPTEELAEIVIKINENSRKYVMCNCWHQNKEESMAMWEKYQMRNSGIAIRTTMRNLKKSLSDKLDVFIGKIEYIYRKTYDDHYMHNYAHSDLSSAAKWTYFPFFHKRKAFEHEHEVRIIIDIEPFVKDYLDNYDGRINPETFLEILEDEFPDICDIGMSFNIDVNKLIDEVIISPYAEGWVTDTVKSVIHKYGFDFEVNSSELLENPTLDDII